MYIKGKGSHAMKDGVGGIKQRHYFSFINIMQGQFAISNKMIIAGVPHC